MTKRTFGGTSRKRKRVSGFRVRMRSHTGRRVIKSRRQKGRERIAVWLKQDMALPKSMRLKGHRTFDYIHKNSVKYYGQLMTFKIAMANPEILISHKLSNNSNNFKVAIAISKKVSKKAVERNKIRRFLHECLLKNINKKNNHKPYWLLVNLKNGYSYNVKNKLIEEFQYLMFKSGLSND